MSCQTLKGTFTEDELLAVVYLSGCVSLEVRIHSFELKYLMIENVDHLSLGTTYIHSELKIKTLIH